MARYEKPTDPRDSDLKPRRPRRMRQDGDEPFPWLWLGLGIVVTVVGVALALAVVDALLSREPLAVDVPTPTIIRLTAPPTSPAGVSQPSRQPTPTPIPTLTPVPTRDLSSPPDEVTEGYYAQVSGTGGAGVTVRGGPSTSNVRVLTAREGALMLIIGGPEEGDDFTWWQVRLLDGTEGWVAGDFLAPAPAPEE